MTTSANPQPASRDDPSLRRAVVLELIRLHAGMLLRLPWVLLFMACGIGWLIHAHVVVSSWVAWAGGTVAAECLRAAYAKRVLQHIHRLDPDKVHSRLTWLAACAGGMVGLCPVLFLRFMPIADQAVLVIVLFATPAAGVSVAVSSRQILAAYSLLILAPCGLSWIMLYPQHTGPASALTALYWLFILGVAGDGEHLLRRAVLIRNQRDQTLQDLERRNADVQAAMERAEQSSQARDRVLAAASHDLRQPLHALSVYSAILVARPSQEVLPEIAQNIDKLVRNLGGLLHGLLDLSRLSAGHYAVDRQRVSLDRLAEDICREFDAQAADKDLTLRRDLQHVRLYDDPLVIGRIVRNLLDNAIKYTDHGHVGVQTCKTGSRAVLAITDTGRGIPQSEQDRIFEEFYQLGNPGRDYGRGVGLGLAIVKRLCDLIGADIGLVSQPGRGTRFEILFDSRDDGPHRYTGTATANLNSLRGKSVYLVDDETDILHAMNLLLKSWGLKVRTAASIVAAEALFEQHGKPDWLIADLRLGEPEDGLSMASRLRQIHGYFPVLIITGDRAPEQFQTFAASGFRLLQKPIVAEKLAGKLLFMHDSRVA
ncbi:MAG: response regulator [Methylomonas sp.]|nr:response regulator [Methylomonas sp.]